MLADLRFALRQLRRSPGFTLTAVVTLALGIGANIAMFTLMDSIMLRPLPFVQQDRLMRIGGGAGYFPKGWIRELGRRSSAFADISGFGADAESNVTEGDSSDRVFGAKVTVNTFQTLDIHPALGRFFSSDDSIAGQDLDVVLSYGYWKEHFGGDPGIVGKQIRIDGISRRIVGVMPAGVRFPYADTQFLIPVAFKGGDPIDPWNSFDLLAFGRLKPGVTAHQAEAELRRLHALMLPLFPWRMPDEWAANMTVVPLLESEVGAMRPRLLLLSGAVGLILLIACANVANLILARAAGREREMAIRGALGATRGRLIRQLLLESLVLGLLAGAAGLIAATASLRLLVRLLPADTPRLTEVGLHSPVFFFAAGISIVAGFLFGLIPALRMAAPKLDETLRSGSRGVAGKRSQFRLSMVLVMGQIGLSVVVITMAGLMLHSLWQLSQVNPGFRTDRTLTAEVSLDATTCRDKGRCFSFFEELLDQARGIAGVKDIALVDSLPMSGLDQNYVYDAEGHPREPREAAMMATGRIVSPDYFSTLGLRLMRGRLLTDQDASGASRAVIINQRMAERLWPHEDPLGKQLIEVADEKTPTVWSPSEASIVVGVVSNTHQEGLGSGFGEEIYLPMTEAIEMPEMYVLLRTDAGTAEAASALRKIVNGLNSQASVTKVRALDEVVLASVSAPRSLTILLLSFGFLAVVIGMVGIYSLIAYIVSWRRREIGIRLALGAPTRRIVQEVVGQSLVLAAGGSAAGLAAAIAASRWLQSFLFDVKPLDPLTFCAVPLLMVLLSLAAAWIPAKRAAAVDPVEALRSE
jgi:predicted permease